MKSAGENKLPHKRWFWLSTLLCLAATAIIGLWWLRGGQSSSLAGRPVPTPDFEAASPNNATTPRPGDLLITLPPDKLANAQLKIETVIPAQATAVQAGGLRTTGIVQSNAYKETPVMPVAGGTVREVNVSLGEQVTRGQKLATIFSTELAAAQAEYLSMQAEIEKHHKRYRRAAELVEIGAISRAEYEDTASLYKTEQAKLSATRQRLLWLGMSAKQVDELQAPGQMNATISVSAPTPGLILDRAVNPGEVVAMGKELFRITDLSTVWVIAQVYEQDLAQVRIGASASISTPAYPQRNFTGRVAYLDPRIAAQTRTAQVRVEVNNACTPLKLGMYVDVNFGGKPAVDTRPAVNVPRAAVQMIGAKQVVFVALNEAGSFAQREVSAGAETNGPVLIYHGLNVGERVVTAGSFLLRAESLKLNPAQMNEAPQAKPEHTERNAKAPATVLPAASAVQTVTVTLTEQGYQPASLNLRVGVLARVTFVRKVEATCGTEVMLPDYGIKRELPLNVPVTVEFTPAKAGELKFACGMDMLRGKIRVK
jgi:RND family efflux transporter MFP subunit